MPLNERAVEVLEQTAELRISDFVFPGMMADTAVQDVDARRPRTAELHPVHGARLTLDVSRLGRRDHSAPEPRGRDGAGAISSEAAYRRRDLVAKRGLLMQDWANYCGGHPAAIAANGLPPIAAE